VAVLHQDVRDAPENAEEFPELLIRDRQRLGLRRDAVPQVLHELNAFGYAELSSLGRRHHAHDGKVAAPDTAQAGSLKA
jgi:hypothetical protein